MLSCNSTKIMQYRYINNKTPIHLLMMPAASSRNIKYYTELVSSNVVLKGYVDQNTAKIIRADKGSNIQTLSVDDAKKVAESLNISLIVSLRMFSQDGQDIEEVYFWKHK